MIKNNFYFIQIAMELMADDFELAIKTSMSITGVEPLNPQWNQEEFNWIVI